MHDPRAASAARFLTRMRCVLAAGLTLSALGVLIELFGQAGSAVSLLFSAMLFGAAWWQLEVRARQMVAEAAPQAMPDAPHLAPVPIPAPPSSPSEDQGAFVLSSMSHDLRQPVQAAALFAATLSAHPLPEVSRKLVSGIESAVEQLSEQIEAVFAIARIDSGRQGCELAPLAIENLLAGVVGNHLDEAHERGLHLRHKPTRLSARADAALLGRALERMVLHALRTTSEGGVLVGCRRRQGKVIVEVWDSGDGVSPELLPEILTPGGRCYQDLVDRGLGLVVAARCAACMGGALSVSSRPGHGTVYRLELDRA